MLHSIISDSEINTISDRVALRHRLTKLDDAHPYTRRRLLVTDIIVDGEVVEAGLESGVASAIAALLRAEEIARSLTTLRLMSSIGVLSVDAKTGKIVGRQYDSPDDAGTWDDVTAVDVDDYYRRYPMDLPGMSYEIEELEISTTGTKRTVRQHTNGDRWERRTFLCGWTEGQVAATATAEHAETDEDTKRNDTNASS